MPWQTFKSLIYLVFAFFYAVLSEAHQPYRDNLPQSTVEIYRSLFQYAETLEFNKIKNYLVLLKPVTTVLREKFKFDFEKELLGGLNKKDKTIIVKSLQVLIYFDIKELSSAVKELGQGTLAIEEAKDNMQTAYLTYLLLSPILQENHFVIDQQIKKKFRMLILTLIRITPYPGEVLNISDHKTSIDALNQWIIEIDTALKTALELK